MKKRIIATLLFLCIVAVLLPATALAADGESAIQLGTGGITDPTPVVDGDKRHYLPTSYIYYGKYDDGLAGESAIKWRVLDADKTNIGTDGMFLLSEYLFEPLMFNLDYTNNTWVGSTAQNWCRDFAGEEGAETIIPDAFSAAELAAIPSISKTEAPANLFGMDWGENILSDDKVFFLSTQETANYIGNYNCAPGLHTRNRVNSYYSWWWLRTPPAAESIYNPQQIGVSHNGGVITEWSVFYPDYSARLAFNLDLNSVLFTSASTGGKSTSGMDAGLAAVTDTSDVTDWKLTLKDTDRTFSASLNSSSSATVAAGGSISVDYSNAKTGSNEYISAMIVNSSDKVLYYGRIAAAQTDAQTISVNIPSDLAAGSYTLKLFNEQFNGDNIYDEAYPSNAKYPCGASTDYSSAFSNIPIAVTLAPVAPTITTTTLGNGDVGSGYSLQLSATGDAAITWSIDTGSLPAGLNLSSDGVISGTPTAAGTSTFTVKASNGVNPDATKQLSITVIEAPATEYTITFNGNGGTSPASQNTVSGKLASLPTTSRDGHSFDGWYTAATDGVRVTIDTSFTADTTVYAHWSNNSSGGGGGGGGGGGSDGGVTKYKLSFETNGGSAIDSVSAVSGTTIDLSKYTNTRTDYTFDGWYSDSGLTNKVTSIKLTGNMTVYAGWTPEAELNSEDHIAYVQGYSDDTVRPNANITRAETAQMLYRLLTDARRAAIDTTSNSFSDVSGSDWYNQAVSTMANGGYIKGYEDGAFGGNKTITRAEFVTMLVRFIGVDNSASASFTDVSDDHWAYQYIATASGRGWINGYTDGSFAPNQAITRAEAMAVINRVLNRGVDVDSTITGFKQWPDNQPDDWYYYEVIEATNTHEYTSTRPSENWTSVTNS